MLEGQCDVWNGVISAAVYIALVGGKVVTVELNSNQDPRLTDIKELESKFKQFHQLAEAKGAPRRIAGWLAGWLDGGTADSLSPPPPVILLTLAVYRAMPRCPCSLPAAAGLCKLDLQLVSQSVESIWLSALYPVNAMRNRALAAARTDAVLLLDVDFWPSAELSELVQKPAKYASLMAALSNGTAVVLPAYETGDAGDIGVEVAREAVLGECERADVQGCGKRRWLSLRRAHSMQLAACCPHAHHPRTVPLSTVLAVLAAAEGKPTAVTMFWDGRIKAFHTDRYQAGHRATDYKKWLNATRPYRIR